MKIYFKNNQDTILTDDYHQYRLYIKDNLINKKATLVFQHPEYETKEISVELVNYPIYIDVNLIELSKKNKRKKNKTS